MAATITAHKFTRTDSAHLEAITQLVDKLLARHHLTQRDVLMGLRYLCRGGNESFQDDLARATEVCVAYDVAAGVDPDTTARQYGLDNV